MPCTVRVLLCCAMIACASCADALGLHDLSEASDAATAEPSRTRPAAAGDAAAAQTVPVDGTGEATTAGETGAAPPMESLPTTIENEAGSDAILAGRDAENPKPPQADDAAAPKPPQGDASAIADAAARDADGAASVCSACGASGCTVHSNGVGQTFEDCQPAGTYNDTQALAACAAFTGSRATCAVVACAESGGSGGGDQSNARSDQAICSSGATACNCWTFSGTDVGLVQSVNPKKCEPCAKGGGSTWN